jgi:DNA-binding PadR family transcriptional regulator
MESALEARSLPVQYVVLGLLLEESRHGYELRKELEIRLGALWRIASSQLYSVLHRLEDRGWVSVREQSEGSRPSRKVYTATGEGAEAFGTWVSAPVAHLRDVRVEFLAKAYFLRRRSGDALHRLLEAQIEVLEELETGLTRQERLESDDAAFGAMLVSFRRMQMRSTIEWLRGQAASAARTEDDTA